MHLHSHSPTSPAQTEGRLIRWAAFYDGLVNTMTLGQIGRLRRMTVDYAMLLPGQSVLDVGCGTGAVTVPAKKKVGASGNAAGIDPSPEMISVARRKAQRLGLDIDFQVGVIEALPFPDNNFDAVTSSLMMHHLPEHLQIKGLAEILRVLKPRGQIVIADMMRPGGSALRQFFTSLALHHGMEFGIEDLPNLLKDAGFEEIEQLKGRFLTIGFVRARKLAA
jgi:ubiquinone/menaquinone biosynthesis C-methylase UbiE